MIFSISLYQQRNKQIKNKKMAYKWRPSATARREFAHNMQNDSAFKEEYEANKQAKIDKKRSKSKFDYNTAGGSYVPTMVQHNNAFHFLETKTLTDEQSQACNEIIYGYTCQEKVNHDSIHIVNELIRNQSC